VGLQELDAAFHSGTRRVQLNVHIEQTVSIDMLAPKCFPL